MTSAGGRWQTQEKSGGAVLSVRSPLHPACPIERGRWRSRGAGAAASGPSGAPGQSRLWTACSPAAAFRRQPCCRRAWLRLLPAWKPCHGPALPLCRMTSSGIRPWGKVGPGQAPAGLAGESGSRAARSPGGDAPDVPRRPHRLFVEKDPPIAPSIPSCAKHVRPGSGEAWPQVTKNQSGQAFPTQNPCRDRSTERPECRKRGSPARETITCGTRQTPPERPDRREVAGSFPQ